MTTLSMVLRNDRVEFESGSHTTVLHTESVEICGPLVTDLEGEAVRELVAHHHAPRDELEVGLAAELAGLHRALTVARARAAVAVRAPVRAGLAVEVLLAREVRAVLGVRAGADADRVVVLLVGAERAHGVAGLAVVDRVARRADGVGRQLARGVLPLALGALGAEGPDGVGGAGRVAALRLVVARALIGVGAVHADGVAAEGADLTGDADAIALAVVAIDVLAAHGEDGAGGVAERAVGALGVGELDAAGALLALGVRGLRAAGGLPVAELADRARHA